MTRAQGTLARLQNPRSNAHVVLDGVSFDPADRKSKRRAPQVRIEVVDANASGASKSALESPPSQRQDPHYGAQVARVFV